MPVTLAAPDAAYRALAEDVALVDRSGRGKLALTGSEGKGFLNGQVSNDVESLAPGRRALRRLPDPEGQDARRSAGPRRWATSSGSTRSAAPCRRSSTSSGAARSGGTWSCTSARWSRRCSRSSARARAPSPAPTDLGPSTRAAPRRSAGPRCASCATDVGVDVLCAAAGRGRVRAALGGRRGGRGGGGDRPRRDRAPALRRRARRLGHPAGGRAQRARRELHEGLLRRPGDRRAPALARASRTATCAGCGSRAAATPGDALAAGEREVGRLGSAVVSPRLGPIALALVRREAEPGDVVAVGPTAAEATVTELPFPPR